MPSGVIEDVFSINSSQIRYLSYQVLQSLRRTAALDEQIIARCGAVLNLEQLVRALAQASLRREVSTEIKRKILCQSTALKTIRAETNKAFFEANRTQQKQLPDDTRMEAKILMSRTLAAAKILNTMLISSPTDDGIEEGVDATWATEGLVGWLRILPDTRLGGTDVAKWIFDGQRLGCDGQFHQQVANTIGRVERVFTSCVLRSGEEMEDHFLILKRPNGGFFVFATLAVGKDSFIVARNTDEKLALAVRDMKLISAD